MLLFPALQRRQGGRFPFLLPSVTFSSLSCVGEQLPEIKTLQFRATLQLEVTLSTCRLTQASFDLASSNNSREAAQALRDPEYALKWQAHAIMASLPRLFSLGRSMLAQVHLHVLHSHI